MSPLAEGRKDDRGVARRVDFQRHFAVADEEELVGRARPRETNIRRHGRYDCGHSRRRAGPIPPVQSAKKGVLPESVQGPAMLWPCLRLWICPDRRGLVRDVDAHWTPGDTAAAADAARRAKLINPSRELVRHPLPIARTRRLAHATAMDEREVHGEAGIPFPHPLRRRAGEIAVILDGCTEAGGADHGAVTAGETALGDIVPARMIRGCPAAAPLIRPSPGGGPSDLLFGRRSRLRPQLLRTLPSAAALVARISAPASLPTSTRN